VAYKLLEEMPERFAKLKAFQKWYLRGPSVMDEQYHFVLSCDALSIQEIFSLPETDMLFEPKRVEEFFGKITEQILSVELSGKFIGRLHGKTAEEVHEEPEDINKIYVCEE